jgi:hypothetical protein
MFMTVWCVLPWLCMHHLPVPVGRTQPHPCQLLYHDMRDDDRAVDSVLGEVKIECVSLLASAGKDSWQAVCIDGTFPILPQQAASPGRSRAKSGGDVSIGQLRLALTMVLPVAPNVLPGATSTVTNGDPVTSTDQLTGESLARYCSVYSPDLHSFGFAVHCCMIDYCCIVALLHYWFCVRSSTASCNTTRSAYSRQHCCARSPCTCYCWKTKAACTPLLHSLPSHSITAHCNATSSLSLKHLCCTVSVATATAAAAAAACMHVQPVKPAGPKQHLAPSFVNRTKVERRIAEENKVVKQRLEHIQSKAKKVVAPPAVAAAPVVPLNAQRYFPCVGSDALYCSWETSTTALSCFLCRDYGSDCDCLLLLLLPCSGTLFPWSTGKRATAESLEQSCTTRCRLHAESER